MTTALRPLPVGINLDGVLQHDGLPFPDTPTRLAWVRDAGVFDYIEKNIHPQEDFAPYFDWIAEYGVPVRVFGGIFCAGRDEPTMRWGLATAGRLGARHFNMQLFARHADGHALSDQEVADFYVDALTHAAPSGCVPSLEVHVDMWSEAFQRVESVANLLARSQVRLGITLDHSHLIFKAHNTEELALSGWSAISSAQARDAAQRCLLPGNHETLYTRWLEAGWVLHAHARSVAPDVPHNAAMERRPGVPGRAIQYPLVRPAPDCFHSPWREAALAPWKRAVIEMLQWMHQHPDAPLAQVSCEFLPFPDYGGGGRYGIWDNNLACAAWLKATWADLQAPAS